LSPTPELSASGLGSERIVLEPLRIEHADELGPVVLDPSLHRFIGGAPPTPDEFRARIERQVRGRSPDGRSRWLNWVVRSRDDGEALGRVQATVTGSGKGLEAEVAWVIGAAHQGQGVAKEAAGLMAGWLSRGGVDTLVARIHPAHEASMAVGRSIGLLPTETMIDGEVLWSSAPAGSDRARRR
jgi:RimJ/RimL family protein N-acetyltransferase